MYVAAGVGFEPTALSALEAVPFDRSGTPRKMRSQLLAYSSYVTANGRGALPLPDMQRLDNLSGHAFQLLPERPCVFARATEAHVVVGARVVELHPCALIALDRLAIARVGANLHRIWEAPHVDCLFQPVVTGHALPSIP